MMTAFEQISGETIKDVHIRSAISGLVRVSAWGNSYLVTVPFVYPSGNMVGVRVAPYKEGYWVSDFALGYREAENFEAQRSFGAHAGRLKESLGVEYTEDHEVRVFANEKQVASAIRRVAYATHRIMLKTYDSSPAWDEQEIGADLYNRLRGLFGEAHVRRDITVLGASNIDWRFTAQVSDAHKSVFFDVVTPHHSSVFSAVSKFNDVRRLGKQTHTVAVVDSFEKMGKWLPLISQETEVIESNTSDETLRNVIVEAA